MEFTYEGLVRYGFGFYNPNHAAAFICAILPFVWILLFQKACWQKILGSLLSVILIFAACCLPIPARGDCFYFRIFGICILLREKILESILRNRGDFNFFAPDFKCDGKVCL